MRDIKSVLDEADRLVADFASNDAAAYFSHFAADATFAFYTHPEPLRSRADYETVWAGWVAEGLVIESCASSERQVQLYGDTAIFSHHVDTRLKDADGTHDVQERETIVFRAEGDGWTAVHEHLSPRSSTVAEPEA